MRIPLILLALAGCSRTAAPPPSIEPVDATPEPATPATAVDAKQAFLDVMHERLIALEEMEYAVLRGDIDAARMSAVDVDVERLHESLPPEWQSRADGLVAALKQVAGKKDLASVARGTATAAAACGSCHASAGARVAFARPHHPGAEGGVVPHMQRHREAAALMREALVSADPARWRDAMIWLAEGPLEDAELRPGEALDATAKEWEATVHGLAAKGQQAEDQAARGELYGEVLLACASCHVHTGGGPKK